MGKLKPLVDAIRDSGDSVAVHARRLSELPGNHRNKVDDVRSKGGRVVAECSFVRGYIEKHPEYGNLIA